MPALAAAGQRRQGREGWQARSGHVRFVNPSRAGKDALGQARAAGEGLCRQP